MKYTKLPVEVDVYYLKDLERDCLIGALEFLGREEHLSWIDNDPRHFDNWAWLVKNAGRLLINTLEGDLFANEGDYIIKGVLGEYYACKPDVFAKTYIRS